MNTNNENEPKYEMPEYEMPENFNPEDYESLVDSLEGETKETVGKNKKQLTKKQKLIIRVVGIFAAVVLVVSGIIAIIKSDKIFDDFYSDEADAVTLTMDDLKISYYGNDGNGAIEVSINIDKVRPRVLKAMGYDEDESSVGIVKEAGNICGDYGFKICNPDNDYADKDWDYITENSINGKLSNGQTVKIVMYNQDDVNNHIAEILGDTDTTENNPEVVLKFEETTYVADGFEPMNTIDIFDDVAIITSGENGRISVEVEYTGDIEGIDSEDFTIRGKNGSLKYGDSVNIAVSSQTENALKQIDGILLERNIKEYVIE